MELLEMSDEDFLGGRAGGRQGLIPSRHRLPDSLSPGCQQIGLGVIDEQLRFRVDDQLAT